MDNPENMTTQAGTQDEEKQNKNTAQYMLDTTMRKQTQIINVNKTTGARGTDHPPFF